MMYHHIQLEASGFGRLRKIYWLINTGRVRFAGYSKGKIFGLLSCKVGKRIKPENRVFFTSKAEALSYGYRPCGSCMREAYLEWKNRPSSA